jgi:hypothetical protein
MFPVFLPTVADDKGFGPPLAGGPVNAKTWTFAYNTTDIASGATLFTLPYQAIIIGYFLNIKTAFDGTGTNTLDFGTTGALTQYGAAFDASVTGQTSSGFVASQIGAVLTTDVPFTVRYNGTSASAGAGLISVLYIAISQTLP